MSFWRANNSFPVNSSSFAVDMLLTSWAANREEDWTHLEPSGNGRILKLLKLNLEIFRWTSARFCKKTQCTPFARFLFSPRRHLSAFLWEDTFSTSASASRLLSQIKRTTSWIQTSMLLVTSASLLGARMLLGAPGSSFYSPISLVGWRPSTIG